MEFLGLFWFVGVFFRIVVRWFYGGLLEGYEFPKSRFSVQAFRFFAVGFEPFRTIECFFPMGFPCLESRRNEGFPDRSKRSVLSLRRSLSYVLFLSKGALPRRLVRRVCPSRLSKFLPSSLNSLYRPSKISYFRYSHSKAPFIRSIFTEGFSPILSKHSLW